MTGNTKMLADAIYDVLPKENCDFYGNVKTQIPQSEMLYIGFWTDKGSADCDTLKLLQSLKNRKVFLFGTAGFGGSDEFFKIRIYFFKFTNQTTWGFCCPQIIPEVNVI